ncbi:gamma subclass chorismate mutase AroQ [Rhodococcus hoagii]|uniref:Chorismate mutase n=1 Tax=Rhodococcus hoagii TaxID=43767 RepID=A0AAE5CMI8_RHOHA|nr:gamma subclass chorismate mutase AroQ [Prescottella equi]
MKHVEWSVKRSGWIAATAAVGVSSILAAAPTAGAQSYAPAPEELRPLVHSIAQRLSTADPVAAAKWWTDRPIDDPARERDVLRSVGELARGAGLEAGRVEAVFRAQIEANKDVQRGLFGYWLLAPTAAPSGPADLTTVRSTLDSLDRDIVAEISARRQVLAGPECLPDLVTAAVDVVTTERIDALHQVALVV